MTKPNPAQIPDDLDTTDNIIGHATTDLLAGVTMTPIVRFVELPDGTFVNPDNVTHVTRADADTLVHFIGGRNVAVIGVSPAEVVAHLVGPVEADEVPIDDDEPPAAA